MLSLDNIGLQKGSFTLKQVTFDVKERDYFVILGRTGSGKTLLLETIAGLHKHTGTVSFRQQDLTGVPPEKRKVGFVYQDFALFPHLSVIKNIRFSDRYQARSSKAQWDELIDFLDLGDLLQRHIHYLSGGEKQRVALARAIYSRPDILLLDEPLSAIDPSFRNIIMENLKGLKQRFQITVVHVTHNFREAAYLADNIGIMMDGKLVQQGPVSDVLHHPGSIHVAKFLGFRNILRTHLIDPDGDDRYFTVNPALIQLSGNTSNCEYSLRGVYREWNEGYNHHELLIEAEGGPVAVNIAKQNYDPAHFRTGAAVHLSFPRSAVTFFPLTEGLNEASV